MAFDQLLTKDSTSQIIEVMLRDSTTGQGKTGVAHGSVTASYVREGATRTAITLASGTVGDAYSSGKWAEVDATNMPGLYQLHIPDGALATPVNAVTLQLKSSGVIDKAFRLVLIDADLRDTDGVLASAVTAGVTISGAKSTMDELQDLTAAQVNAEVDTAISDAALDDVPGLAIDIKSQVDIINVTCQNSVSAEMTERGYTSTRAGYIDRLDAAVTTRLASASYTAPANSDITAIKAKTDNLPASPAAVGSEMALADSAITAAKIAADAITEAKIADNAIATEHLAATAIQKIWDRLTSNLTTTGSIGKYIVDNSGGGGIEFTDTVDANPAANTVELAFRTILNNLDAAISAVGGTAGAGSIQYTDVVDDGTNPIDGVACWVTNDALGQDLVAGTVFTNANGEFTFMLDAGDYYLWLQKSGYNFPAEAFTVTAP